MFLQKIRYRNLKLDIETWDKKLKNLQLFQRPRKHKTLGAEVCKNLQKTRCENSVFCYLGVCLKISMACQDNLYFKVMFNKVGQFFWASWVEYLSFNQLTFRN